MAGEQELKFPVRCGLRIIFEGEEAPVLAEASMVLATFGIQEEIKPGNTSPGGKYRSLSVMVTIPDRLTLEALPQRLSAIPGVRMVL